MSTFKDTWSKLANSKKYREEFAVRLLKRSIPFQIKTLRKKRCGSQAILAERAKLTQGVVSRAEDQEYGNLTFNTVGRIASGLDMAFIGRFVPFSDLARFSLELSEEEFSNIPTFEEENAALGASTHQLESSLSEASSEAPAQLLGIDEGSSNANVVAQRKQPQSAIGSCDDRNHRQTSGVMPLNSECGAAEQSKAAAGAA